MRFSYLLMMVLFITAGTGMAEDVVVENLSASDVPNDGGGAILLKWNIHVRDILPDSLAVERSPAGTGNWTIIGFISAGVEEFLDQKEENGPVDCQEYLYRLVPYYDGVSDRPSDSVSGTSSAQWINSMRIGMLIILIILTILMFYFISEGKKGKTLYIRKIAGLAAVEDAVGRATEMGRPVLYIPGIMDMDNIQTIASMVILGRIAVKTAEYGSPLIVPVSRSVVMTVAQEIVKESYLQAGRPDAFIKDNIFYLTDDQFGYAAGVDGIMVRQKPAAIFLLGTFYAESLILAETGRSVGAIQIAGTAMPSQLPFFIAACDYTLIGEELFAASAYLSREPKLLGSLKGQDVAKAFFILIIVAGVIVATIGDYWEPAQKITDFLRNLVHVE